MRTNGAWTRMGWITAILLPIFLIPQSQAERWEGPYTGAMGSYLKLDDDSRAFVEDEGWGVKLLFGWPVTTNLNLEILADFDNLESVGVGTDFYRHALELDALYHFGSSGWAPFVVAGIGVVDNDVLPNSEDKVGLTANAGLGLMSAPMTEYGLRLRGDVRYVYDDFQDKPGDVHANLGVVFPLRKPGKTVEVVTTREVIREVPVAMAPVDSDGDGVMDNQDRCPNTLPGTEVDQFGCAKVKAISRLEGVNFEYDSARITPDSAPILNRAVEAMQGQPGMQVEVAGHTCSIASDEYNQRLSERRAAAVVEFLTTHGIERDRMMPVGYGESEPAASNDTEQGRQQNRRVEFRVRSQ